MDSNEDAPSRKGEKDRCFKTRVEQAVAGFIDDPAVADILVVVFGTGAPGRPAQRITLHAGDPVRAVAAVLLCAHSLLQDYQGLEDTDVVTWH